jgi:hypothetical protein
MAEPPVTVAEPAAAREPVTTYDTGATGDRKRAPKKGMVLGRAKKGGVEGF